MQKINSILKFIAIITYIIISCIMITYAVDQFIQFVIIITLGIIFYNYVKW